MCATIGSLIIVLLTLLQVKYENKDESPFDTDGLVMMLFIVTMLINTLVAVATITVQAWFPNHSLVPVLNQICFAFGVLASSQASAASPMAQTSVEQQDGFSEISNDMNV
ncbi:hypothetical protein CRYUN_Cryun02cG0024900 [Craigia yunnanensis]